MVFSHILIPCGRIIEKRNQFWSRNSTSFIDRDASLPCSQKPCQWTLFWAIWIQITVYLRICSRLVPISLSYLCLVLENQCLFLLFQDQNWISRFCHAGCICRSSHRSWFNRRNNIWWKIQIMDPISYDLALLTLRSFYVHKLSSLSCFFKSPYSSFTSVNIFWVFSRSRINW